LFDDTIAENARLKAEVERLRKAGDALVLIHCGDCPEQHKKNCALAWLAAKEGKQS
jgi:hypothetical protein